jgi:hypothetical protein
MTKPAHPQPKYRLELQAQPGPVDPVLRLRRLLKALLRAYGFRCLSVAEVPSIEGQNRPAPVADTNEGQA